MGPFNSFINSLRRKTSKSVSDLGTALHLPEFGISEKVGGYSMPNESGFSKTGGYSGGAQGGGGGALANDVMSSGAATAVGGGTTTYDPNTDPTALLSGRNTLREKIAALNNIYGSIYNDLNALTAEKRGSLESDYAQQYQTADKGYQSGLNTVSNNMASRGLADSSYSGQEQDQVTNTYKQDISNLDRAKQAQLAQIGQFYSQTLGGLQGAQNQYNQINPDAYTTVNDINSRVSALDEAMNSLAQQQAGLKTDSQYVKQLQGVAPAKSMTSDELSKQLQTLVTSSAPRFAKEQIAQGLIRRAQLQDEGAQAFWSDYFQKLLAGA
mgnify:CR=1 FL=1